MCAESIGASFFPVWGLIAFNLCFDFGLVKVSRVDRFWLLLYFLLVDEEIEIMVVYFDDGVESEVVYDWTWCTRL